jgi:uncharacterized protein YjbJ (UPF0337 family)
VTRKPRLERTNEPTERLRTCAEVARNRAACSQDSTLEANASSAETSADERENPMGEIIDKVKGRIKQAAGALAGDKRLKSEGKVDETKGEMKGAVEDVKQAVKDNR